MTALATAPAQQLGLPVDGLEAPPRQVPDAEVEDLQLACSGYVRHAEVRISTDGHVHLTVQVMQPHGGLPFVAVFHGEPHRQVEFEALRDRLLVPCTCVMLRGERLELRKWHGDTVLQLVRCSAVHTLAFMPERRGAHLPTTTTKEAANAAR